VKLIIFVKLVSAVGDGHHSITESLVIFAMPLKMRHVYTTNDSIFRIVEPSFMPSFEYR